jgi:hypothetical protein
LRLVARGLPSGRRVAGALRLERAPELVRPLFLGDRDSFGATGATVRFELVGDGIPKGIEIVGGGAVVAVELDPAGAAVPLVVGTAERYAGGRLDAARLELGGELPPADGPELRLWTRRAAAPAAAAGDAEADAETERRLRALGYLQ